MIFYNNYYCYNLLFIIIMIIKPKTILKCRSIPGRPPGTGISLELPILTGPSSWRRMLWTPGFLFLSCRLVPGHNRCFCICWGSAEGWLPVPAVFVHSCQGSSQRHSRAPFHQKLLSQRWPPSWSPVLAELALEDWEQIPPGLKTTGLESQSSLQQGSITVSRGGSISARSGWGSGCWGSSEDAMSEHLHPRVVKSPQ